MRGHLRKDWYPKLMGPSITPKAFTKALRTIDSSSVGYLAELGGASKSRSEEKHHLFDELCTISKLFRLKVLMVASLLAWPGSRGL